MDIHIRFTIDAPRGWARRVLLFLMPAALVGATAAGASAYETGWIEAGEPISAGSLVTLFDAVQADVDGLLDAVDGLDTRLVAVETKTEVHATGANTIATGNNDFQKLTWTTVVVDPSSEFDEALGTVTVTAAGTYLVCSDLHVSVGSQPFEAAVFVSGEPTARLFLSTTTAPGNNVGSGCNTVHANPGDVLDVRIYTTTGANYNPYSSKVAINRL